MAQKIEFNVELVKKYAFWVAVPLGLVIAVLAGWMAVASVDADLNTQKKTLEDQKKSMDALKSKANNHPNEKTIEQVNKEKESLAGTVYKAWVTMSGSQAHDWGGLARSAMDDINRKNFLDPLLPGTLTNYRDFARIEIDELLNRNYAKTGDLRLHRVQYFDKDGKPREENKPILASDAGTGSRPSAFRSPSGYGIANQPQPGNVQRGKVVWDNPTIDITLKNWDSRPQSFEVWLTQEDIWVYQALLWVVAKSNDDGRQPPSKTIPEGVRGVPVS
jgi:hypothetical protein